MYAKLQNAVGLQYLIPLKIWFCKNFYRELDVTEHDSFLTAQ